MDARAARAAQKAARAGDATLNPWPTVGNTGGRTAAGAGSGAAPTPAAAKTVVATPVPAGTAEAAQLGAGAQTAEVETGAKSQSRGATPRVGTADPPTPSSGAERTGRSSPGLADTIAAALSTFGAQLSAIADGNQELGPGLAFGLRSAPVSFNLLTALICAFNRRALKLPVFNFYDDHCLVDPSFAKRSGKHLLKRSAAWLNLPFSDDPEKSLPMRDTNIFLGVRTSFASFRQKGEISLRVSEKNLENAREAIESAILASSLSPQDACSLRDLLQFTLSWSFGRFGRAALQAISDRQYHSSASYGLSDALLTALEFFRTLLKCLPPFIITCWAVKQLPIIVWSDAAWEPEDDDPAMIGFVIFVPHARASSPRDQAPVSKTLAKRARKSALGTFFYAYLAVPECFMRRFKVKKQYIGQLELLAAVTVYCSWPKLERATGRDLSRSRLVHYIDNSSALAAIIKGYSGLPDSARIVYAYHCLLFYLRFSVWNAFVKSSANVGDMPTRLQRPEFREFLEKNLQAQLIDLVLPPLDSWDEAFSHWSSFCTAT